MEQCLSVLRYVDKHYHLKFVLVLTDSRLFMHKFKDELNRSLKMEAISSAFFLVSCLRSKLFSL